MATYPNEFLYSKEHEWIHVKDDVATLGITQYAQDSLGDVVFVELPEMENEVGAHDEIGTIESVKAVAEIYSPVSGSIVEVNTNLEDGPEAVNAAPHGEGWIAKIKLSDPGELDSLMSADDYLKFLDEGD